MSGGTTVTVKYQHTDALGAPVAVTDAAKAIVETFEYEPYGQLVNSTLKDGPGFTGHVQDAATGLTYMQQRYYDPQVGLFLSVDPVTAYGNPVDQFNRYRYGNGSPYKFKDPDGRQSCGATGSRLCMSEAGLKSRLAAIERHESKKTYETEARVARAFANRALPLQQASGREIGANIEKRGEKKLGLTDFSYGTAGEVTVPRYAGYFSYVGMIHTHPVVHEAHRALSGSGATSYRGKLYGVGPTDLSDVAEAYRRGGVSIVVDPLGDIFQFSAASWRKEADKNPNEPYPAGWSIKKIEGE